MNDNNFNQAQNSYNNKRFSFADTVDTEEEKKIKPKHNKIPSDYSQKKNINSLGSTSSGEFFDYENAKKNKCKFYLSVFMLVFI